MALPSGYKRLKYIKSSGTQYINTEVYPNQSTTIELVVSGWATEDTGTSIFGVNPNSGGRYDVLITASGGHRSYYNGETQNFDTSANTENTTTILRDGNTTSIGDVSVTHTAATFACDLPLFLFAQNNKGTASRQATAKIVSCKILDNGMLSRDYIPCETDAGEIGLWDDVNIVFYPNAGTGTFEAGPVADPTAPVGDHNTLTNSVAREIESGTVLVGGVARDLEVGIVLKNGVVREIEINTGIETPIFFVNDFYETLEFMFEPGMTWNEYIESSYNEGRFRLSANGAYVVYDSTRVGGTVVWSPDNEPVGPSEAIVANTTYVAYE